MDSDTRVFLERVGFTLLVLGIISYLAGGLKLVGVLIAIVLIALLIFILIIAIRMFSPPP